MIAFTIISVTLITALFLVWYFTHKSSEKERLLLIEKGLDVPPPQNFLKYNFQFPWLKIGILIISISFGVMAGLYFSTIDSIPYGEDSMVPLFILLFGGIGMVISNFIGKRKR